MAIELVMKNLLMLWLYPTVVFICIGQCFNSISLRIKFHMVLLDGAVSQLLVELNRTLNGQSVVEFDFKSI